MSSDSLSVTLVKEPVAGQASSKAQVGLVEGPTAHFNDEIVALLRQRLKAIALIGSVIFFIAFWPTLPLPGHLVRLAVFGLMTGAFFLLRSKRHLSYRELRCIEIGILGVGAILTTFMAALLMISAARAGNYSTVVMEKHFNASVWTMVILIYGFFIPNTWKRALIVLLPHGCLPYATYLAVQWYEPLVARALGTLVRDAPLPLPIIAVFVSCYATQVIHTMRRDEFKARRFGQYRIKELLGEGGMGKVFRADHLLLKRPCAIKLIQQDAQNDQRALKRFEQEVQATASLTHPNIVTIFDYGHADDGTFYYVMEFMTGMSLYDLVDKHGPIPPGRAAYFLRQTCRALHEAHAIGLIHRDLKPDNIFASIQGTRFDVAKLLDFGLVKAPAEGDHRLTIDNVMAGTPDYMAPEQAVSFRDVDARSDIYAMGAVAYFLLTGMPPFRKDQTMAVILAHAHEPVIPPSEYQPAIPQDLEEVVLRCLEKKPENRFQEALSIIEALSRCACEKEWTNELADTWWQKEESMRVHGHVIPENRR